MRKVIYKMNDKGEFPGKYVKGFKPSPYTLPSVYFAGETPVLIDDFKMVEISNDEYDGLRLFGLEDGELSKFTSDGDNVSPKEMVNLTEAEKTLQISTKKIVLNIINNYEMDNELSVIFSGMSSEEIKTWTIQKTEAQLFLKTNDILDAPFINMLSAYRGEDITVFATKIINKSNEINIQTSNIIGKFQKIRNEIDAAQDNIALNNIIKKM